ncbi:hypothetical protein AAMO2058_001696200 [Amorphochlora amoebiformis]
MLRMLQSTQKCSDRYSKSTSTNTPGTFFPDVNSRPKCTSEAVCLSSSMKHRSNTREKTETQAA